MIYVAPSHPPTANLVVSVPYGGVSTEGQVVETYHAAALAHFYEPSTRQLALTSFGLPISNPGDDLELDSPPFNPTELVQFASRGFARQNRWRAKGQAGG